MKILKSTLKQLIKEELENVLNEQRPTENTVAVINRYRPIWMDKVAWPNYKSVQEEPLLAFQTLIYALSDFWNSEPVSQSYLAQKEKFDIALKEVKKVTDRATAGKIREAVSDIYLIAADRKRASALAGTELGRQVGLKSSLAPDEDAPLVPPPEDDPDDL